VKREIVCNKCLNEIKKIKATAERSPEWNEGVEIKTGKLIVTDLFCDNCNTPLKISDTVHAVSMFKKGDYFKWEHVYLKDTDKSLEYRRVKGESAYSV
jgi:hypothetical protein